MGNVKQDFLEKIEKLQQDYAECKIDTEQFDQGLKDLGIHSKEERMYEQLDAEEARYEFKLDPEVREERHKRASTAVLIWTIFQQEICTKSYKK